MAPKDPYADSPYDDGGMPIGTTYADYDNTEERRKNQVKTREVKQVPSINDIDYTPPVTEQDEKFLESRVIDKSKFNGATELPIENQVFEVDDSFLDEEEPATKDAKK